MTLRLSRAALRRLADEWERASVIPNAVLIAKRYAALSAPAQTLTLCFDAHRPDGKVWAVKVGRRWKNAAHVTVQGVTLETVYRGPKARQPRAYLTGRGRVTWQGTTAVIRS